MDDAGTAGLANLVWWAVWVAVPIVVLAGGAAIVWTIVRKRRR